MFDRPLVLWRPTATPDGSGGQTEVYAPVEDGDPLRAKVDQPDPREQLVAAQAGVELTHSIYFDGVVDVRRGDELRDPGPVVGERFRVVSVVRPSEPIYTKAATTSQQYEES